MDSERIPAEGFSAGRLELSAAREGASPARLRRRAERFAEVKPILDMLKKAMPTYGKTLYDPDARVRLAAAKAFDNLANARLRIVNRATICRR